MAVAAAEAVMAEAEAHRHAYRLMSRLGSYKDAKLRQNRRHLFPVGVVTTLTSFSARQTWRLPLSGGEVGAVRRWPSCVDGGMWDVGGA